MKALTLATMAAFAVWGTAAFGQEDTGTARRAGGMMGMHNGSGGVSNPMDPDQQGGMHAGFVDENGDGINDLSLDADGDGVPNGMDPDYAAANGTSHGQYGSSGMGHHLFVDEDGDGINDLSQDADGDGVPNGMDPDYRLPAGLDKSMGHNGGGMMGTSTTKSEGTAAGATTTSAQLAQRQMAAAQNSAQQRAMDPGEKKSSKHMGGMGRQTQSERGALMGHR